MSINQQRAEGVNCLARLACPHNRHGQSAAGTDRGKATARDYCALTKSLEALENDNSGSQSASLKQTHTHPESGRAAQHSTPTSGWHSDGASVLMH